jgi:hypothetical protein
MSIRGIRSVGVVVLIGLSSFATKTNADQGNIARIERVLEALYAVGNALGHPGDVSPNEKELAVNAIQAAISMLRQISLESR